MVLRPGRKGITLSIDPNSDDELYEVNELEDTIETVIKLTKTEKNSGKKDELEKTSTVTKETQETPPGKTDE